MPHMNSEDIFYLVDKLTDQDCQDINDIAYEVYDANSGDAAAYGHAFREALKVRLMRPIIEQSNVD